MPSDECIDASVHKEGTGSILPELPRHAEAEVRLYRGRSTIFVNSKPLALTAYSPVAGRKPAQFRKQSARFFPHGLDLYLVTPPCGILPPGEL
jgi:hypothetical protein